MSVAEHDSAAKRRRDRRLRMHWRHEQLTLRMALYGARGLPGHGRRRSTRCTSATGQMTPLPRAAAAEYYPLTPGAEAGGVLAAGGLPSPLVEVRPQERVLRRTVGQKRRRCHVPGPRRSYAADGGPTVGAALVCSLS